MHALRPAMVTERKEDHACIKAAGKVDARWTEPKPRFHATVNMTGTRLNLAAGRGMTR